MSKNKKIIIFLIVILLLAAFVYLVTNKKKQVTADNNRTSTNNKPSNNTSKEDKLSKDTTNVDNYDKDALISFLPIKTNDYSIDFEDGDNGKYIINITLTPILNYDWQKNRYNNDLRLFRTEAINKLKSYKSDLSGYTINIYPQKDLNNLPY